MQAGIGGAILPKGDFSDVPGCGNLVATLIEPKIQVTASVLWPAQEAPTRAAAAVRDLLIAFVEKQCVAALPTGAERIVLPSPMACANNAVGK